MFVCCTIYSQIFKGCNFKVSIVNYHLHNFILEFSVIKVWHASIGKLNMHNRLHLTIASDDGTHEVYTLLASVAEVVLKVVARLTTLLRLTSYTFNQFCMAPIVDCDVSWECFDTLNQR